MANKFLNGIEVSSSAVVDGGSLSTGSTILDIQGSQGQLFSVTNSLVGDLFSVSDISGVPILNVNSSGDITLDGNVYMPDAGKLNFGNSNDLQIYHDGSASYISEVGTGDLIISADNDLTFKDGSGNIMANMNASNSVELMYGNSRKFETSNTGITITGNISAITASGHDFMLGNSNNTSTADTSGFRMHQSATYDDGRYAHRFRKYDHGGGIPLYIDGSGSTANIFTALARFGTYTDEGKTFEVFGTMGATNFSGSSSGTNTGDQTLPTDFVVKSTGGTFDGNLSINIADTGSAPAMTALFNIRGYEGRGAGIKIKDSANSAADASNREWFIGSGYSQSGFNIGYSATGSQSSYTAQNKFALSTDGNAIFAGTVTANGTQLTGNQTLPTDFVSAANGGTFGGNLTIKHPSSPTLTLTDDSPDPDNIGTIRASNNYMDFGLDSAEGVTSSRMRFLIDGASAVEFLPNTTYFKQTNIHFQDVSVPQFNFRKDAAIGAGSDIGKINFAATNDDGANYTTGGNIIVEGDGSGWDLSDSSVLNAPTRIKIQLRNSSGALQNAIMLSSNLNANFYGDISAAGDVTANGVTLTGDQTLPSDFVSAANGGTFAGDLLVSKDSPLLTLKNTTDEHTNGGAESKIVFKDHADNSLGKIEVSHNGTNDNALGNMYFQTSNGSTILTALELNSSQNATFASDVTVTGDLTVNGTTTTLNTATVEVEDNILQLNTTQGTPDTATAATSGISIYRGVDENDVAITQASLIFDEADDTWDLTNNLTIAGDVLGASFAVPSGASTGFLKANGSVDGTSYSGYNFGGTDLTFQGADPGDIVWKDADGTEVHRIWSGSADYLTYRNDAGTTYELISAGSTGYNNGDWDNAFTHAESAHAPTDAEQNVQADWNETTTTSDAFILNKLTDYVSAASGGTFSGDLAINADLTINGSTDGNGAVTPRTLDFTTNPTNAGLAGSGGYQIGEIAFTGKDSSSNAAGKYGRIRGSIVDSNTTVQGSGGEGGKLQFTLLKHDAGGSPRVEYDILTLDPLVAEVDGQLDVTGNIRLTGGGTIEAPSTNGAENLILKAAGGVDVIIDTNGNGGDNEMFRVMHHTDTMLFEIQEGGEVRFADGIRISGTEDRISSVGSSMYIGGGGFGNSLVQFSGKPIPDSSYAFDFGASNRYWNQCYLGTIHLKSALLSNQENTNIDAATSPELVAQVAHATYTAAFFDFVIKKGTNIKSGTVFACHDGTNVEFTETSTADLGDTSDVTLSVDISGANMRLLATVTSDDWSVKSLIRAL